ncbi:YidC/Oxa1 family membrane protein insertase [Eubacterium sp.]|uniref:YidC/Oxa1 family membrane protein insertase n=1 Tax=Eubacterium sp. TaxID=142586 RepID=UPI0015B0C869|nr:YidC/Oxa1 family membrane protein insertase [uncultured Eubacterium sp.]
MDSLFLLTQNSGKILGPIAKVLGYLMNAIYAFMDKFLHIQNVGLTIILFTIVIYLCLLPLTYKQQKFSKMSQIMNPEIQAIQKKYKNRRDQASVQAMNEETQAVYQKYGVSPSGSCVFMLIQLPILFALYRVIYNVPAYITHVKNTFDGVVTGIMGTSGYQDTMNSFLETVSKKNSVFRGITLNFSGTAQQAHDSIIDVLYKCTSDNWALLQDKFSGLSDIIANTQSAVEHFNNFLGINIVYSPKTIISTSAHEGHYVLIFLALLVPILAALTQFLNIRLMPQAATNGGQQEAMAGQMKMMNYMMPLYSVFIVFFLPVGVGIYWIAGSLIRSFQQFLLNKHFDKMDLEKIIKENQAKATAKNKKKIEKKGVAGEQITNAAKLNTRNIQYRSMADKAASVSSKDMKQDTNKKYKEGSMASKANLVKDFNNKNTK